MAIDESARRVSGFNRVRAVNFFPLSTPPKYRFLQEACRPNDDRWIISGWHAR
jgi:hypothetical protein